MEHVSTLTDAVDYLSNGHPVDLTLLDLTLPDSSGLGTLKSVLSVSAETPIVVLSGNEDADVAARAVRHGAVDFLVKGTFEAEGLSRTTAGVGTRTPDRRGTVAAGREAWNRPGKVLVDAASLDAAVDIIKSV